jgi:hypothetical protein
MDTHQHLDAALDHLRAIGHGHDARPLTRELVEHASALLREAWIDHDGQTARRPEEVHRAVAGFYRLQTALLAKAA